MICIEHSIGEDGGSCAGSCDEHEISVSIKTVRPQHVRDHYRRVHDKGCKTWRGIHVDLQYLGMRYGHAFRVESVQLEDLPL